MNTLNSKTEFCCFEFFSFLIILSNSHSSPFLLMDIHAPFIAELQGTRSAPPPSPPFHKFPRVQAMTLCFFKMKENVGNITWLRRQMLCKLIKLQWLKHCGNGESCLSCLDKTKTINASCDLPCLIFHQSHSHELLMILQK